MAGDEAEDSERRGPEEVARIRDETLARLMRMPPKQQKDMKLGKSRNAARKRRSGTTLNDPGENPD